MQRRNSKKLSTLVLENILGEINHAHFAKQPICPENEHDVHFTEKPQT